MTSKTMSSSSSYSVMSSSSSVISSSSSGYSVISSSSSSYSVISSSSSSYSVVSSSSSSYSVISSSSLSSRSSTVKSECIIGPIIGDQSSRYALIEEIEEGGCGLVCKAVNTTTEEEVAIKLEHMDERFPTLPRERRIYEKLQGGIGIPRVLWFGQEAGYNVLVMDILGPSLEDLFEFCGRRFSMKTVLMLADQMIKRIEYVHCKNFVHRDIKPDNFLMGTKGDSNTVFLIDFGIAKQYWDKRVNAHIPYREEKKLFVGSPIFTSMYTHLRIEHSRRDDMLSLGYMLLRFIYGTLPWERVKEETQKEIFKRIQEKKMSTDVESLCAGVPEEFSIYLNYCESLTFEEAPDYKYIRKLFRNLFYRLNYKYDNSFDWTNKAP